MHQSEAEEKLSELSMLCYLLMSMCMAQYYCYHQLKYEKMALLAH